MLNLKKSFSFLNPVSLTEFSNDQIVESASVLCKTYEADVTQSLVNEVFCFRNIVSWNQEQKN